MHKSIKYGKWASTRPGNLKLQKEWREYGVKGIPILLFFSVNQSKYWSGVAQMTSDVDLDTQLDIWSTFGRWTGAFSVRWLRIKDVDWSAGKHIVNPLTKKVVHFARDTQELPLKTGVELLKVIEKTPSTTALINDFDHYDKEELEMLAKKQKIANEGPQ